MGRFAMAYAETSSFPQTITDVPTQLGYISSYTLTEGAEATVGLNQLKCKVPGVYKVEADISLSVDTADNFYIYIYKNGINTGFRGGTYIDTNGIGNISLHGIIDLDVNDVVELYVSSGTAGSYEITVNSSQFSIVST